MFLGTLTLLIPHLVGAYPAVTKVGGGYVWDDVLEYRVWCHPEGGAPDLEDENDYYRAFATHAEAVALSQATEGGSAARAHSTRRIHRRAQTGRICSRQTSPHY